LSIFVRRVTGIPAQSMAGSAVQGCGDEPWVERRNIAEDDECNWKAEAVDQRDRTSVARDFRAKAKPWPSYSPARFFAVNWGIPAGRATINAAWEDGGW